MQELLKKNYRVQVEFFGEKMLPETFTFVYLQGSLRETLLVKESIDRWGNLDNWLFEFLIKNQESGPELTRHTFEQMTPRKILDLSNFILSTYCKGYFEKVKESEDATMEGKKSQKIVTNAPFSSTICVLLEKTNETLETLLDMTWEQITYIISGIVWNMNESTPKGKARNKAGLAMGEHKKEISDEEAREAAQKLWEKMEAKKNNQQT